MFNSVLIYYRSLFVTFRRVNSSHTHFPINSHYLNLQLSK
ncbi:protein of unknown function [Sterolibacterium denitrificans]|uniref:Uncharacterized protein n=1 Tax=Sterolibacterium denitrificans TaxID=157592 RepID=A0A7Z7HQD4_9PROT|nr:protein of unknown function [Sterolibacterium denitrificans]